MSQERNQSEGPVQGIDALDKPRLILVGGVSVGMIIIGISILVAQCKASSVTHKDQIYTPTPLSIGINSFDNSINSDIQLTTSK